MLLPKRRGGGSAVAVIASGCFGSRLRQTMVNPTPVHPSSFHTSIVHNPVPIVHDPTVSIPTVSIPTASVPANVTPAVEKPAQKTIGTANTVAHGHVNAPSNWRVTGDF